MTIDPRVGMYLSIALALIGALAGGATELTTLFGADTAKVILASCVLLLTAGNALNAVLHAMPSSQPKVMDENKFLLGPKI